MSRKAFVTGVLFGAAATAAVDWAYRIELAMRQFLAAHPEGPKFEISGVECRTTLCEIRAIGFDESASPGWPQIVYDLRQRLPGEFGQVGTWSSTIDGRHVLITVLWRDRDASRS